MSRFNPVFISFLIIFGMVTSPAAAAPKQKGGAKTVPVLETGQSASIVPGDDGDLEIGFDLRSPRFVDQQDGTVFDLLTNLMWLKDGGCLTDDWIGAFETAASFNAGLDFSCAEYVPGTHGNWRIPNIREYMSLANYQYDVTTTNPPLLSNSAGTGPWIQGDPFINVFGIGTASLLYGYYSSTAPGETPTTSRFYVWTNGGEFVVTGYQSVMHLWLVRGPESSKPNKPSNSNR